MRWCRQQATVLIIAVLCVIQLWGLNCWALNTANYINSVNYTNAINDNTWDAKTSVFECRLEQQIPFYGQAVFRTRAGENSSFYLKTQASYFKAGEASMMATTPVWVERKLEQSLGRVAVKQGRTPLFLDTRHAELMMSKLNEGMEIELQRPAWFDSSAAEARLAISAVGFRMEYQQYLKCLSGLLPANFNQLERTALYFEPGPIDPSRDLSRSELRKLDNILTLVKHDKTIKHFYVDGHTDNGGDRADNLALSKGRAELISQYLARRGIPESWITVRWHGERYPAVSNASKAGRAKNRRVTVRLERVKEIDVLPIADAT